KFSAVGFEPQTLSGYNIKNNITLSLSIRMKELVVSMEQLVVVGYGTQRKKDLTGSVSSVKSKEIADLAVTRIEQALLGKVAGVQVKPVSGEPGVSPQIRIRGIGSISAGASPLYVVDGFPIGNIESLNPNDIESLDILKDASATAIYGSRGSNGVIIINTKRGRAGKTKISFDTYHGWQKVSKKPEMMNAREQAQYFYDGIKNRNIDEGNNITGAANTWTRPVPAIILDVLQGRNNYDVDALNAVLVTAPQSQYQITASGGTENLKFALSGEYLNQDGIVLNSHFDRYSMRANLDAKLSPRLTVKINLNPSFTDKKALPVTGNQGENILGSAISVSNFYPLMDSAGNYLFFGGLAAQADFHNPLAIAREYQANQKGMRFLGNLDAEYKFSNAFSFRFLLGGSYINSKGMTFKPQLPVFFNNPAFGSDFSSASYNWLTEYTLNYNKSFGLHQLSALGGFTAQKERGDLNSLSSNRYPNNLVPTLSAVSGLITNGTSETYQWSMVSYLGR
ncbi:MAG: SusC/RagA family TonB-linked outer membrane protein, partial [Saprospiraceae bacterium]